MTLHDLPFEVFAFFGGIQVIVCGFAIWLGQLVRDRRLEKLKNELHQSANMHKARFDREFEIYSQLWPKLRLLRDANHDLMKALRLPDAVSQERLLAQGAAVKALREKVEDHRPFFSDEIASELGPLLELAEMEARRYSRILREQPDRPKELVIPHRYAVCAIIDIRQGSERICDLIRGIITGQAQPSSHKPVPPLSYTWPPITADPGPTLVKSSTGETLEFRDGELEPTGI